jgi:hypothetical protein
MMVQIYNFSTQEAKAGRSKVHSQPERHSKFHSSLSFIMIPCLKKKKKEEKENILHFLLQTYQKYLQQSCLLGRQVSLVQIRSKIGVCFVLF